MNINLEYLYRDGGNYKNYDNHPDLESDVSTLLGRLAEQSTNVGARK